MRKLSLIVLAICAVIPAVHADEKKAAIAPSPSAAPAAAVTAKATDPTKIELKNKSTFQIDANSRNPFWPIGWKPAAKLADSGADRGGGPDIPVTAFVVSAITIEQKAKFAIINGKVMQEGQQFGLQIGNQTYQVTLQAIEDGRVIISRHGQELMVPLRRK